MSQDKTDYLLYAIVDLTLVPAAQAVNQALAAERGGATVVQLRGKKVAAGQLLALAEELRAALRVPLIVNDRVDVAAMADAAGVHLGDLDLPLVAAAKLLPGKLLGRTVRTPAAARAAEAAGAAYLGVGSVYASPTKGGLPVIGTDGLAAVVAAVDCPVVAIGGIDRRRAAACIDAGAVGVAMVSELFGGGVEPARVTERAGELRMVLDEARRRR